MAAAVEGEVTERLRHGSFEVRQRPPPRGHQRLRRADYLRTVGTSLVQGSNTRAVLLDHRHEPLQVQRPAALGIHAVTNRLPPFAVPLEVPMHQYHTGAVSL